MISSKSAVNAQQINIPDADLTMIIDAWPGLPDAIKAGILAMVRAANDEGIEGEDKE